jgi:hypothetical protein
LLHRIARIIVALVWALICMAITVLLLALAFGQSLDGIKGNWQFVPLIGQAAVLLAVGVFAFRHAMRGSAKSAERRAS